MNYIKGFKDTSSRTRVKPCNHRYERIRSTISDFLHEIRLSAFDEFFPRLSAHGMLEVCDTFELTVAKEATKNTVVGHSE